VTNVRVFDGKELSEPRTVVIDGALIGDDPAGARTFDAAGGVLLPGFIDAHIHLHDRQTLDQLAAYGVTTGLDMATFPAERVAPLRDIPGVTDIRSAGIPAIGPGGLHAQMSGMPDEAIVRAPEHAKSFVAARVAEGSDYLKIVLEAPGAGGPEQPIAQALVDAAHDAGLLVVAHAASVGAYRMALDVGAEVITHAPLGPPLETADVVRMAAQGPVAVPTLVMMKEISALIGNGDLIAGSMRSATELYRAGVPILAGTDSNVQDGSPSPVEYGDAFHRELEFLVEAGLSTVEALRAATELPARYFGLTDRGAIKPGLRADLVLLDGDPIADIRATRGISRVWCAGIELAKQPK
jgi:imidazolonepropionase-like amidohydrolase